MRASQGIRDDHHAGVDREIDGERSTARVRTDPELGVLHRERNARGQFTEAGKEGLVAIDVQDRLAEIGREALCDAAYEDVVFRIEVGFGEKGRPVAGHVLHPVHGAGGVHVHHEAVRRGGARRHRHTAERSGDDEGATDDQIGLCAVQRNAPTQFIVDIALHAHHPAVCASACIGRDEAIEHRGYEDVTVEIRLGLDVPADVGIAIEVKGEVQRITNRDGVHPLQVTSGGELGQCHGVRQGSGQRDPIDHQGLVEAYRAVDVA